MKRILVLFLLSSMTFMLAAQMLNAGSYNIRHDVEGDYKKHNGWNDRKDHVFATIRAIDYDIFGIQEPFHNQVQDLKQGLEIYDFIGIGRDDGKTEGEYAPIFYKRDRFTVLDSGTFWFSPSPQSPSIGWDAKYNRICTWGLFKDRLTKQRFYFFNLHLDHKGVRARRESALMLIERIKSQCGKDCNFIITGDFNVDQTDEVYQIFAKSDIAVDSFHAAKYCYAPCGTFNAFKLSQYSSRRIDYALVSRSAKVERYAVWPVLWWYSSEPEKEVVDAASGVVLKGKREMHMPSDHNPLQVVLSFNKKK